MLNFFIIVMLIINSCAFLTDLFLNLYLSFSRKISQEEYPNQQHTFKRLFLLIPAMNELATLKPKLPRLNKLHNQCRGFIDLKLVFIDDDSDDGTSELLDQWSNNNSLYVIHRVKPNAQIGKGPALQDAVNHLRQMNLLTDQSLIGVVDADSRFDSSYLKEVVETFENSTYDLVQTRVEIYNATTSLVAMQNFEFSVYNSLVQLARTRWGSALASGNGQFVTVRMAENVGWSNSLLEDCEFSLRGLLKGYYGTFLNRISIKQEGVTKIGKLVKQRTRWCQGGIQCLKKYGKPIIKSKDITTRVKVFSLVFLFVPFIAAIVIPSSIVSVSVLAYYARFNPIICLLILLILLLTEYTVNILLILKQCREAGIAKPKNFLKICKLILTFIFYRWFLAFIPYYSFYRELRGRNSWVKTSHHH